MFKKSKQGRNKSIWDRHTECKKASRGKEKNWRHATEF